VEIDPVANHVFIHGRLSDGAMFDLNVRHLPAFASGLTFEIDGTDGVLVASIDSDDLPGRGIRSLGEQLNQATLRGGRTGEPVRVIGAPEHRWVPQEIGDGPALAIAQLLRRFGAQLLSGAAFESDFDLALRRHELFATQGGW